MDNWDKFYAVALFICAIAVIVFVIGEFILRILFSPLKKKVPAFMVVYHKSDEIPELEKGDVFFTKTLRNAKKEALLFLTGNLKYDCATIYWLASYKGGGNAVKQAVIDKSGFERNYAEFGNRVPPIVREENKTSEKAND